MKRFSAFICVGILMSIISCGKKHQCRDYTVDAVDMVTREYFGMYKPGNWWVYQNTSGTKKDSIYVVDYSTTTVLDDNVCAQDEHIKFTIKSSRLVNGNDLYAFLHSNYGLSTDIDFSLLQTQTQSEGFPQFHNNVRLDKFSCFPEQDNAGQIEFDNMALNNNIYRRVLQGKSGTDVYCFAKSFGLVSWTTKGETFNLIRWKIQ